MREQRQNSPEAVVWKANAIWLNHRCPQGQFEIMSSERCFRKKSIAEGSEGLLPGLVVKNDGITVGPSFFFSFNSPSSLSRLSINMMLIFKL